MVDFAKLREENKKRAAKVIADALEDAKTKSKWSYWERFQHLLCHHLSEMTTWEEEFCYSSIAYISEIKSQRIQSGKQEEPDWDIVISKRVKDKLKEIEDTYCTQVCHAMQNAGVGHGNGS